MSHCAKIVFLQIFGDVKNEVFEKTNCIFCFCLFFGRRKKQKKIKQTKCKRPKNPLKIGFLRWSSKKVIKIKNGFLAKLSWKEENTRIFVHTICFGQKCFWTKTVQTRKNYKNSGFSGNCPKPKMTPFL